MLTNRIVLHRALMTVFLAVLAFNLSSPPKITERSQSSDLSSREDDSFENEEISSERCDLSQQIKSSRDRGGECHYELKEPLELGDKKIDITGTLTVEIRKRNKAEEGHQGVFENRKDQEKAGDEDAYYAFATLTINTNSDLVADPEPIEVQYEQGKIGYSGSGLTFDKVANRVMLKLFVREANKLKEKAEEAYAVKLQKDNCEVQRDGSEWGEDDEGQSKCRVSRFEKLARKDPKEARLFFRQYLLDDIQDLMKTGNPRDIRQAHKLMRQIDSALAKSGRKKGRSELVRAVGQSLDAADQFGGMMSEIAQTAEDMSQIDPNNPSSSFMRENLKNQLMNTVGRALNMQKENLRFSHLDSDVINDYELYHRILGSNLNLIASDNPQQVLANLNNSLEGPVVSSPSLPNGYSYAGSLRYEGARMRGTQPEGLDLLEINRFAAVPNFASDSNLGLPPEAANQFSSRGGRGGIPRSGERVTQ